jgi:hypothetical protein
MKKKLLICIICSLIAFALIGCGGVSISFNTDDKSAKKEVKQDQSAEDKSNVTDKANQNEDKKDQNPDDKSNVTVNITNDPSKTNDNKDVIVIRDPIPANAYNGDFIFYNSNSAYLTQKQVSSLTNFQLGIARNEIYAKHGYIFDLEQFRSYFNSKSWYIPITKDVTLNSIETYNVELIKAEENRRGIVWN